MKQLLLFVFFLVISFSSFSGGIKGIIRAEDGSVLPFASIYIRQTESGAATDLKGYYEINLPAGQYELVYKFLGYQSTTRLIDVADDFVEVNVILKQEVILLSQVTVKAAKEDPAYTIMRKAIAKAKYHTQQIDSYSAHVYIKGKGKLVHHRISGQFRTGIGERSLHEYQKAASETGLACWLSFYHHREREIDEQSLAILGPGIAGDPGHEGVFGERMRFWALDRFTRFQIEDEEIAQIAKGPAPALEPKTEHPWKDPKISSTVQDGFSFVQTSEFEAHQNYLSHTRRCKLCDPSHSHVCAHGRQLHDEWKRAEQAQGTA